MKKLILKVIFLILSSFVLSGCIAVGVGIGAATATKIATDPRTTGTQLDDEIIEEKILYHLDKDQQLREEARINVVVYNNIALLIGQVPDVNSQIVAKNITEGLNLTKLIYNEIRIAPKISYAQTLTDSFITSQVKAKMLVSNKVKASDIKVITENGEVFLMGSVTGEQADNAAIIASQIKNVKKVIKAFKYLN